MIHSVIFTDRRAAEKTFDSLPPEDRERAIRIAAELDRQYLLNYLMAFPIGEMGRMH